jgi:valyl-tRNA synthetase
MLRNVHEVSGRERLTFTAADWIISFRTTNARLRRVNVRTGKPFVKYWLHNNLVTVGGQKMSKSLGNFVTLKEAFTKYEAAGYSLLHPAESLSQHARLQRRGGGCRRQGPGETEQHGAQSS